MCWVGMACLMTPARSELGRRSAVAAGRAVLFSLGVWSLATTGPLVLVAALVVLAYTARTAAVGGWPSIDLAVLAAGAIATTLALADRFLAGPRPFRLRRYRP